MILSFFVKRWYSLDTKKIKERFQMKELFKFPDKKLMEKDFYVSIIVDFTQADLRTDESQIQFSKLLNQAEKEITNLATEERLPLQEQLNALSLESRYFTARPATFAFYITPHDTYYYKLGISTGDRLRVGAYADLAPLVLNYQFPHNFHVLVLNQGDIRLFEATDAHLKEIELGEDAPATMADALGTEREPKSVTFSSRREAIGASGIYGHQDTNEEKAKDRERYFRSIDDYIYQNYSKKTELPLILYALKDNQMVFRDVSTNQYLSDYSIDLSGSKLTNQEILENVKDQIVKINDHELEVLEERFRETPPSHKIVDSPDQIALKASTGAVEELVMVTDYNIEGSINEEGYYSNEGDSFRRQLIEKVYESNGSVYFVDPDREELDFKIGVRLRY